MEPKVSVIIPVYNVEKYLGPCLDSILGQTLNNIEVICVDDGSTDRSLDILREYEKRDARVKVLTQPNTNAGAARNKGIQQAKGEYLSFLDSDDHFDPTMLEKCAARMDQDGSDVLVFGAKQHNMRTGVISDMPWSLRLDRCPQKSVFTPREVKDYLFNNFQNWPWNKLFRRSFVEQHHITYQEITRTNDMAFVCQALAQAGRISVLDEYLAYYRVETGSSLQQSNHRDPMAFTQAFVETKRRLEQAGLYHKFEKSFLNVVLSGTRTNLYNMKTVEAKERVIRWIQSEMDQEFHMFSKDRSYFYMPAQYDELKDLSQQGEVARQVADPVKHPKVSVIMPSLNVGRFIRECIASVSKQTLEDIEIICVDAGSTDGTLELLEYAAQLDHRIQVVRSDKKSYGYQMNLGLDAARGEYIGIVETDDWIEPTMFETMYQAAKAQKADMVKCNYHWFTTGQGRQSLPFENLSRCQYGKVFCPRTDDHAIFTTTPAIWSGIYRKDMITSHGIRFHETPGASFQDTSFHFMVCTVAQRCYLLEDHLHHYRKDNDGSSVHSKGKVFCVSDEMHYYEQFLEKNPQYKKELYAFYLSLKYEKYRWNYERLTAENQWSFMELMHREFQEAYRQGQLDNREFTPEAWENLSRVVTNPIQQFKLTCKTYSTRPNLSQVFPAQVVVESRVEAPKVSVIIPMYNVEEYIAQTVDSVLGQADDQVEVVCVNDGSVDATLDIVRDIAQRDGRVTLLHQINKGQSAARNVGMQQAKGEFIIFLDGDDMLEENTVATLYPQAVERELDVLYYDGKSIYDTPELEKAHPYYKTAYEYLAELPDVMTGRDLFCRMKDDRKYRASPCLGMYRKSYLLDKHLTFVEGIVHEDNLFSIQSLVQAQRVAHVTDQLLIRRVREGSTVTMKKTFMHIYGYLTCMTGMYEFIQSREYDQELQRHVATEIKSLSRQTWNDYALVEDKGACRGKLTPAEDMMLNALMAGAGGGGGFAADEANLIRASWTYRIGSFFTFIPRKIRGGIRCYQENGKEYTINRVKEKFAHLFGR